MKPPAFAARYRPAPKVGAPVLFAATYIAPIVSRFLKLYPNVEIELMASDEQVDLLAGSLDVAVRIGEFVDEFVVARRLHAMRVVTVGTPSYFVRTRSPRTSQGS